MTREDLIQGIAEERYKPSLADKMAMSPHIPGKVVRPNSELAKAKLRQANPKFENFKKRMERRDSKHSRLKTLGAMAYLGYKGYQLGKKARKGVNKQLTKMELQSEGVTMTREDLIQGIVEGKVKQSSAYRNTRKFVHSVAGTQKRANKRLNTKLNTEYETSGQAFRRATRDYALNQGAEQRKAQSGKLFGLSDKIDRTTKAGKVIGSNTTRARLKTAGGVTLAGVTAYGIKKLREDLIQGIAESKGYTAKAPDPMSRPKNPASVKIKRILAAERKAQSERYRKPAKKVDYSHKISSLKKAMAKSMKTKSDFIRE